MISGIYGIDKINSSLRDGFAQIIVQFVFSKPVDQATQDIRDAISAVRSQLPAEILEPIIQRFDPNQLPIVSLALTSTVLSPPQLTQLADPGIASELRAIAGVAQVNVVGGDSAQLNINVRPTDLAAFGVGIDQVVKARIAQLQTTLPGGTRLEIVRDAGDRVRHSVRNVEEALVEGALLTVLVVFLFLNSWRSTVITGLALPVSVLTSFVPLALFGFTLNTMSLLGLSLAIGILIDDAIVVRENIVRHIEMGKDHLRASHEATDEIGLAVAATTFAIVAVFVPAAFMYGIGVQWWKPFALT